MANLHLTYPPPHIEMRRPDERFGAQQQIRMVDFSVFTTAPRRSLMALLKGYIDDSHDGPVWSVGGYIGTEDDWLKFEGLWKAALDKHGVPYFHMKEMGKQKGAYSHWYPREHHQAEIAEFFKDVTAVIRECGLIGVCSVVRADDIKKFNSDCGHKLEAYPLAAYSCLIAASYYFPNTPIQIIFDHCDKITSKLLKAQELASTDTAWSSKISKYLACTALAEEMTFKVVPAIQSADYLAWELRKDHVKIQDWHRLPGKPDALSDRREHFEKWVTQNDVLPPRKSLDALMTSGRIITQVWTYEDLVHENTVRNGVWS